MGVRVSSASQTGGRGAAIFAAKTNWRDFSNTGVSAPSFADVMQHGRHIRLRSVVLKVQILSSAP